MEIPGARDNHGLMLATIDEAERLEISMMGREIDDCELLQFGTEVINSSLFIPQIIEFDAHMAFNFEFEEELTEGEQEAYRLGLNTGYVFVVGYMSLLGYLRSDYGEEEEYIDDLIIDEQEMPVATYGQVERVCQVREGIDVAEEEAARIDIVTINKYGVENSAELAELHALDFIEESVFFETFLDKIKQSIEQKYQESEYLDIATEALEYGVYNALEMYIQSREQAIIEDLELRIAKA